MAVVVRGRGHRSCIDDDELELPVLLPAPVIGKKREDLDIYIQAVRDLEPS